jgi:hypothetical protein
LNVSAEGRYCLALRGNGELAPAHWGALGNLIEKMGLPAKQAGGSSASITMFLTEAIANNFLVQESRGETQNVRAAFLMKSLEGFADHLSNTPEWKDFLLLNQMVHRSSEWLAQIRDAFKNADQLSESQIKELLNQKVAAGDPRTVLDAVKSNFRTGLRLGLISETNYAPLLAALTRVTQGKFTHLSGDAKTIQFYAAELYKTLSVFGAFDAQTDDNLFFRPGIVDFAKFAEQVGRIATFYSTINASENEKNLWRDLISTCGSKSAGLTWSELAQNNGACAPALRRLIETHFEEAQQDKSFLERIAGETIASYPTTSVLVGEANTDARHRLEEYAHERRSDFGRSFQIQNSDNVMFGYWGSPADLAKIESNLPKTSDEKSRRFKALGPASWHKILSLSPAEPGLAALQPFTLNDGEEVVSAGGWSDLHPVLVLRASGCDKVIYVTRRGGESMFGQGVAKRLLGYDRDWADIKSVALNNGGDRNDMTSLWSKLYNLANRTSSISQALQNADAVLCTDWDRFKVTNGIRDLIKDAYKSPYFIRNREALRGEPLFPELNARDMHPDGYPIYAGCFAP